MKTNNKIVAIVAIILAILFVLLWYMLGFNKIDAPLDLALGIVMVCLVAIFIGIIHYMEEKRRKLLRAVYVENRNGFNTSRGPLAATSVDVLIDSSYDMLDNIEYTYDPQKAPEGFEAKFVVETDKFDTIKDSDENADAAGSAPSQPESREARLKTWTGTVRNIESGASIDFDGINSLRTALGQYF